MIALESIQLISDIFRNSILQHWWLFELLEQFCQTSMKQKVGGQETKNMNNQRPEWKSSMVRTARKWVISVMLCVF